MISLMDLLLILPAFLVTCWMYSKDPDILYLPFVVILGVLSIVMALRAIHLRPDNNQEKSETEIDELSRVKSYHPEGTAPQSHD